MAKIFQMAFELVGKMDSSFQSSFKGANDTMSRTRREIKSLRDTQRSLDDAFKKGVINQQSHANAVAQIAAQNSRLNGVQSRMVAAQNMKNEAEAGKSKYGAAAMGAMGVGAVLFGPAIASAVQFESAMADVKKVVDFDTPEQFKAMGQDVMVLSQRIPLATEGLAAIIAAGGQSGIARGELLSFAESAAKMGVAFDITADEAGDMMAKWRTAFKMNQTQVVELADKINYLGNTTAASAPKISDVVRRIGPLGEVGGVASGEIAALGASMVGAGIESEVAATGIKNMVLGLVAGEGATKSQASAFSRLGLDATDMAKRMQTDAKGAILEVLARIQALDKYEQTSVLKSLFGSESLGAISPLLSNLDALKDNLDKVADASKYTGSMEAEFAARSATTANTLQLTKNSINAAATNLGTVFLPAVNKAAGCISGITNSLATWAAQNPATTQSMASIAAGVVALVGGVGALGYAFNFVKGGIAGALGPMISLHKWLFVTRGATTQMTGAQYLLNGAFLSCPAYWLAAAFAAVVAAGVYLYQNWDELEQKAGFWGVLCNEIKYVAGVVGNELAYAFNVASNEVAYVAGVVSNELAYAFKAVKNEIQYAGEKVVEFGRFIKDNQGTIETVAGVIGFVFAPALIKSGVEATVAGTKITANFVAAMITSGKEAVINGTKASLSFVATIITAGKEAILTSKKITGSLIASMIAYAAQGWKTAYAIGAQCVAWIVQKSVMAGAALAQNAVTLATGAWILVGGIASGIVWALSAAFAFLTSPIGLTIAAIAAVVAAGVWMYQNWDEIKAWLVLLWNDPMAAIDQFIAGLTDKFTGVFSWLNEKWNWVCSLFNTPIQTNVESGQAVAATRDETMIQHAEGGIFSTPHYALFAEAGPEAVVPLDGGSSNSIGIWQRAGAMLGVYQQPKANLANQEIFQSMAQGKPSSSATVIFQGGPVTIRIDGSANIEERTKQGVVSGYRQGIQSFEDEFKAWNNQKMRVGLA